MLALAIPAAASARPLNTHITEILFDVLRLVATIKYLPSLKFFYETCYESVFHSAIRSKKGLEATSASTIFGGTKACACHHRVWSHEELALPAILKGKRGSRIPSKAKTGEEWKPWPELPMMHKPQSADNRLDDGQKLADEIEEAFQRLWKNRRDFLTLISEEMKQASPHALPNLDRLDGRISGTITATGTINWTGSPTGALAVDLGGLTAGSQFDQVNISGTATLANKTIANLFNNL